MPRYKCGPYCSDKCRSIIIPGQESKADKTSLFTTICSHVYIVLSFCNVHGRHPYDKNIFIVFHWDKNRDNTEIAYFMETFIVEFTEKVYILVF